MDTATNMAHRSSAAILGLGTCVPKFNVDCATSAQFACTTSQIDSSQSRAVNAIYRRTGIAQRGSVLLDEDPGGREIVNEFYPPAVSLHDRGPGTSSRSDRYALEAPVLAEEASRRALDQSGIAAQQITHLVTVTCTGFNAPGIDVELIDRLGLPTTTERIQVGFMGCHGAINGLRAAIGLCAGDSDARILMCSVELCSLHFQYGLETDQIVSNALFADGAASLVLQLPEADTITDEAMGHTAATGSCLVPDSRQAMTWRIGDHGYEMTLSANVPSLIENHLKSYLVPWLAEQGESVESIGGWAVHPGGSRILSAVESGLNLEPSALAESRAVLAEHGNMSSPTMLFILERFVANAQPKPWLMLGFGPGLEIEVALIR